MKNLFLNLSISLMFAMGAAWADDAHHPEKTPATPAATKTKPAEKSPPAMMDNMKKMQAQMQKLHATSDPKIRAQLLQEHMQTMQENMRTMQSGMMDGTAKSGVAMPMQGGQENGQMGMMQMMMDQMMEHQKAMQETRK